MLRFQIETIWIQAPGPSPSSTDGASLCFPLFFSTCFVFGCGPWLLTLDCWEVVYLFNQLTMIYWVLSIGSWSIPKTVNVCPAVHIQVSTREYLFGYGKAWMKGDDLEFSESFYADLRWAILKTNSVIPGPLRIKCSVSSISEPSYK